MAIGRLSTLPAEILTIIFKLTEDSKVVLSLEAIHTRLPRDFQNAGEALDAINVPSVLLPSSFLINEYVAFIPKCNPHHSVKGWIKLKALSRFSKLYSNAM
ncbi:hypothetical protein HDU97_005105 [Phlyctochytrium planicorne]|nr:hypothetical protein HDU97_005105 [Phlyctochytrium planicorne]